MATFKFTVPYTQRQVIISDGYIDCEIEAESREQALRIFHENRVNVDIPASGRLMVMEEDNIEVVDADDIEYEEEEITWE